MKYNSGLNQIYQLYFYCLHPWFIFLAYFFYLQTYSSFAYSPCWILLLPLMLLWPDFPHFRVAVSHISTWIFICAFPKHHYLFLQPYSSKLLSFFPIRYHDVRFLLNSHRFLHSWHSQTSGKLHDVSLPSSLRSGLHCLLVGLCPSTSALTAHVASRPPSTWLWRRRAFLWCLLWRVRGVILMDLPAVSRVWPPWASPARDKLWMPAGAYSHLH